MYEIIVLASQRLYQAKTVEELREIVETVLVLDKLPPQYSRWSNSRCIAYLVQAGYIMPYSGPEWFMELRPAEMGGEDAIDLPKNTSTSAEIIRDDGTVIENGTVHFTFWHSRNHIRVVFKAGDHIHAEIFINESSARAMWAALGRVLGLDQENLSTLLQITLPSPLMYNPEIPPEKTRRSTTDFDILNAINELDLNLDFDQDNSDEDSPKS